MKKEKDFEMQSIRADYEQFKSVRNQEDKEEINITVFLSYDIVDSTRLKDKHPDKWVEIIGILLNHVEQFRDMAFWKFNGDEILFKVDILSVAVLSSLIQSAYRHLGVMQNKINKVLSAASLKGTMWVALTSNLLNDYAKNYRFIIKDEIDFTGKHIDEGFRLTKLSSVNKLAIDPKMVYILMYYWKTLNDKESLLEPEEKLQTQIFEILSETRFIGDELCKGVWDNKPYPVYWYYHSDSRKGIRYGEFLNGVHLWQNDKIKPMADGRESNGATIAGNLDTMERMFRQVDVYKEINEIINMFELFGGPQLEPPRKANLYFMIACINPCTGSVLIAQRSRTRKHLKGVWDFGNVKYRAKAIEEVIPDTYQSLFGISINLITDSERGNNLKPFGYCTIYRNKLLHNGVLCYAFIDNKEKLDDQQLLDKIKLHIIDERESKEYQDVQFLSKDLIESGDIGFNELEVEKIREDSYVAPENHDYTGDNQSIMYFYASVKGALQEWKRVYGTEKTEQ